MDRHTMPGNRKFCDHCGEFVSERTYRRHSDLKLLNQGLASDENESLVRQDKEVARDFREEEQGDELEVPGNNNVLLFYLWGLINATMRACIDLSYEGNADEIVQIIKHQTVLLWCDPGNGLSRVVARHSCRAQSLRENGVGIKMVVPSVSYKRIVSGVHWELAVHLLKVTLVQMTTTTQSNNSIHNVIDCRIT